MEGIFGYVILKAVPLEDRHFSAPNTVQHDRPANSTLVDLAVVEWATPLV